MGEENSNKPSAPPRIVSTAMEAAIARRRQPVNHPLRAAASCARTEEMHDWGGAILDVSSAETTFVMTAPDVWVGSRAVLDSGTTLSAPALSACWINLSADHLPPGSSDGPSFQIAEISR